MLDCMLTEDVELDSCSGCCGLRPCRSLWKVPLVGFVDRNHVYIQTLAMNIESLIAPKIGNVSSECKGKRFRQTQQMLNLDLVSGFRLQQRLQQPKL